MRKDSWIRGSPGAKPPRAYSRACGSHRHPDLYLAYTGLKHIGWSILTIFEQVVSNIWS